MDSPKIPTLKDSQKPQVKVRGLEAGVTLFDRLKQFKKKDLAFILAGLGTLFMAPLAEHFMMAPEQASDLTPGMAGNKGGSSGGLFGGGSSPYEPGANGLAQGAPSGGGSDIITPLNVRDPSALVMGPGATQQPPTQSVAPATPPPTAPATKDSDLRDALAASGARAAGAASKAAKALMPVPKVALSGAGGLRGLGVTSGGSSASSGGGAIQSSNTLAKANAGGGLSTVKAIPGYRGAASGRGPGQGGSGAEALKAAAEKAGNIMNQGSASTALDAAARQDIPGGGAGLGGSGAGGTGATDKGASGNQDKNSKNVGESLDFLKAKAIQEKKIELWGKEQEANDMNLLAAQVRNDAIKGIVGEMAKSLGSCAGKLVTGGACVDPTLTPGSYKCIDTGANFSSAQMKASCPKEGIAFIASPNANGSYIIYSCVSGAPNTSSPIGSNCVKYGATDAADSTAAKDKTGATSAGGPGSPQATLPGAAGQLASPPAADLGGICSHLSSLSAEAAKGSPSSPIVTVINRLVGPNGPAGRLVAQRDALAGTKSTDCSSPGIAGVTTAVVRLQNDAIQGLQAAVPDMRSAIASNGSDKDNDPFKKAKTATDAAQAKIAEARKALELVTADRGTANLTEESFTPSAADQTSIAGSYQVPGKTMKFDETPLGQDLSKLKTSLGLVNKTYDTATQTQDKLDKGNDAISAKVTAMMGPAQPVLPEGQAAPAAKDAPQGGTIAPVIQKNKDFLALSQALAPAAAPAQGAAATDGAAQALQFPPPVKAAKFTLAAPNSGVIQSAKGNDSNKGQIEATTTRMQEVTSALTEYGNAPDDTKKTNIQNNMLTGGKGLPKVYETLWTTTAGPVNSLGDTLTETQKALATAQKQ